MSADDILYSPLGMQSDNKDLLWQLFLSIIPPEVNLSLFTDQEIEDVRRELWEKLDQVGPINIKNADQLRELLIP
jgi:hypothetical protein